MFEPLRRRMAADLEAAGGRHDEPEIYGGPPGDPGLAGGPGSLSWEIHGDLATLGIAGTATVLMELLHPSVMAGVHDHSSFWVDPDRRARNTLGYVLRTTFGNTQAATRVIEGVKRIHSRIGGVRPDGVAYRALDPELIAWVHTSIPWGVMLAHERYARPLSIAEKDQYLREQAPIGLMGGADWVPQTVAELDDYVERMRPKLAWNGQIQRFMDFIAGRSAELPSGASRPRVPLGFDLRCDGPDARLGAAPDGHRAAGGAAPLRAAARRPVEGAARALGIPGAAVRADGARARERRRRARRLTNVGGCS